MRASWDDESITAGELLDRMRDMPPLFSDAELDVIRANKDLDTPPEHFNRVPHLDVRAYNPS
ncbi:MAG: hypothetical protein EOM20_08605 [Spartobacteria bacterium]|nr:hypothetical protein [Spartobacteria bacterium]